MRQLILSLVSGLLAAAICPAQSLWVGAVTGPNQFNFSPNWVSGEFTNLGSGNPLALYDHSGSDVFSNLELIVGFVNPPSTAPYITGIEVYKNVGNVGSNDNISTGPGTLYSVNLMPSGPTQLNSGKANSVLPQFPGLSPSENTSNFDAAELQAGITQTSGYALYSYDLSAYVNNFGGYGLLEITFGSGISKGAVAFGWGCGGADCKTDYTSVATQSGFAGDGSSPVPEPATLALLGSSLVALGLCKRRRNTPERAAQYTKST